MQKDYGMGVQETKIRTKFKVWLFTDGKIGHEKQSKAFVEILRKQYSISEEIIDVSGICFVQSIKWFLGFTPPIQTLLDTPDLIIGTGHRTHFPMLAARRIYKGKIIVIMKPSMPLKFFDLCLIPKHDRPKIEKNVLITNGPLSSIKSSKNQNEKAGLIMLGGPNKQFTWSNENILNQIYEIIEDKSNRELNWQLTTSRRTPPHFIELLRQARFPNLSLFTFDETPTNWIEKALAQHATVWVTQDSFSMIYEAIQSGAKVGLLEMPPKRNSLFYRSSKFKDENLFSAVTFSQWKLEKCMSTPTYDTNNDEDLCTKSISILGI